MIILITLLVALIGLLMYTYSANPKLQEVGRILFFNGTLVTLLEVGPATVSLFHR